MLKLSSSITGKGGISRSIGVGAQSTLGGNTFLPENVHENLTKCLNFTWDLPEKLTKFPNFTWYMPEKINKVPEFYTIFARKNSFCPNLGQLPPAPRLLRLWPQCIRAKNWGRNRESTTSQMLRIFNMWWNQSFSICICWTYVYFRDCIS